MVSIDVPGDDLEDTRDRARAALDDADDPEQQTYLESLITVIEYHQDETFDTNEF